MKKELKDYLHLYLGCKVEYGYDGTKKIGKLVGKDDSAGWQVDKLRVLAPYQYVRDELIKPILRPLSDMTEDEKVVMHDTLWITKEEDKHYSVSHKCTYWHLKCCGREKEPEVFLYLLSKHFDLFGLIDAGLAIDKTKL